MKDIFKKNWMATAIIILTIVLVGIFMTTIFMYRCQNNRGFNYETNSITEPEMSSKSTLRLVHRDEWLAESASIPLDQLVLPSHRVIIAHTATENCTSQATCTYRTRFMQNFHMKSLGFQDIAYNFLVGGDGNVYEGRGWDLQGVHTKGYNVDSIGIAFIGTFTTVTPPEKQLNAAKLIIEDGIRLNKLVKDYRLFGTRQLVGSESPGRALYEIIKKWPNWSESI